MYRIFSCNGQIMCQDNNNIHNGTVSDYSSFCLVYNANLEKKLEEDTIATIFRMYKMYSGLHYETNEFLFYAFIPKCNPSLSIATETFSFIRLKIFENWSDLDKETFNIKKIFTINKLTDDDDEVKQKIENYFIFR